MDDLEKESVNEMVKLCDQVSSENKSKEASPRSAYLRRIQHHVADEQGLNSISVGEEPHRRVRVFPR